MKNDILMYPMAEYNSLDSKILFRAKALKEGFIEGFASVSVSSFISPSISARQIHHLLHARLPFYGSSYISDNNDQEWLGADFQRIGNDMNESISKFERAR